MIRGSGMRLHLAGVGLLVLLLTTACGGGSKEGPSTDAAKPLCADLVQLRQEIDAIREGVSEEPGGLQGQVGTSESTAYLAGLADLQRKFTADAQQYRDAGQPDVADKVSALADQLGMVVQRNTLEGVGSGDPGTDPTVNVEQLAKGAGTAAGCPSP